MRFVSPRILATACDDAWAKKPMAHGQLTKFAAGDRVHVASIGKGTVREVRNGGRCLVEVSGRSIVTTVDQLKPDESSAKPSRSKTSQTRTRAPYTYESPGAASASIDLHGHVVDEALDALSAFLNSALLAGHSEVRIIHGRSGGKIKSAVHAALKRMPSIRSFVIDPGNAGVTIVKL